MNNIYSLFARHRLAAFNYSRIFARVFLPQFFVFVLIAWTSLYSAQAHSAQVCPPQGFDAFPSMPATISIGKINAGGGAKVLYESSLTASTASPCSSSSSATLDFIPLYSDLFSDTIALTIVGAKTASTVQFMYSARSTLGVPTGTGNYSIVLNYYITVTCTGASITAQIVSTYGSTSTFRVTGLPSCSQYTVNYKLSILQNDGFVPADTVLTAGGSTNGIRMRATVWSNSSLSDTYGGSPTQVATYLTYVPGSTALKLISGVYCTYSLSPSTIDFGTLANYEIMRSLTPKPYSINLQNCMNASGRQVSIFWRFANPDSGDSSAMTNSVAGGASGVVAQTSCTNALNALARHNQQIAIASNVSGNLTISCSAALVPAPGVNNSNQITPGRFSGSAYLVFQFQ